jgi:hypothetical protein
MAPCDGIPQVGSTTVLPQPDRASTRSEWTPMEEM